MARQFSQDQLNNIMEQSMVSQCACPSLLTRLLSDTRYLHEYQKSCLDKNPSDQRVHAAIGRVTEVVASILEASLVEILTLEGWESDDQGEFKMPDRLVALQMEAVGCSIPLVR